MGVQFSALVCISALYFCKYMSEEYSKEKIKERKGFVFEEFLEK